MKKKNNIRTEAEKIGTEVGQLGLGRVTKSGGLVVQLALASFSATFFLRAAHRLVAARTLLSFNRSEMISETF